MLLLEDSSIRDRFVFVVTHYAPRLESGRPDSHHHGLVNAEELLAAVAEVKRGALLCGHVHRCFRVEVEDVGMPVFCAGSATYLGREGLWLFDVDGGGASVRQGYWTEDGWQLSEADEV